MFIKKDDKVRVIVGRDKDVEAAVPRAPPRASKVTVEGVVIVKKHQEPSNKNSQGAIIERETPTRVSNVQVLDKSGVAGRAGYKIVDDRKARYNEKPGGVLN